MNVFHDRDPRRILKKSKNETLRFSELNFLAPHAPNDNGLKLFDKGLMKTFLGNMANSKTPGPDRLTAEFYKTFFDILSNILLEL